MEIQTRKESQATVIAITGRLDAVTVPEYEKQMRELIDAGNIRLVIDLAGVEYISSAGLRGLLVTAKLLKVKSGALRCANVSGPVREVFEISGFASIFQLDDSVGSSLASLG